MKPSRGQAGPANQDGDRLNKFLASCGLGSRRGVEALITEGRVEVNGDPCLALGTRITEEHTRLCERSDDRSGPFEHFLVVAAAHHRELAVLCAGLAS